MTKDYIEVLAQTMYDRLITGWKEPWEELTDATRESWGIAATGFLSDITTTGYKVVAREPTSRMIPEQEAISWPRHDIFGDLNIGDCSTAAGEVWTVMFDAAPAYPGAKD